MTEYPHITNHSLQQVSILTKKVEQLKSELEKRTEEQEDSVMDVKRRHEREKAMLLDENKKLIGDVERVSRATSKLP